MAAPLAPAVRAAIEGDLRAGLGLSRNALARKHHVSGATVSKIAAELEADPTDPIVAPFDRARTAKATADRQADQAEMRTVLAGDLLGDAARLRKQLWEPFVFGQFGGRDNVWAEVRLDQPRFTDQSTILGAVEKATRTMAALLGDGQASQSVDRAAAWLDALADEPAA